MDFYAYQRPLGKIDDIAELRSEFITIYDTNFTPCEEIVKTFEAMQEWLDGKTNYHKARNLCDEIYTLARNEQNPIKARFFRTMAQIGCGPHVKYHGLWSADFGITLINRLYPQNTEEVKKEREKQIELINQIN